MFFQRYDHRIILLNSDTLIPININPTRIVDRFPIVASVRLSAFVVKQWMNEDQTFPSPPAAHELSPNSIQQNRIIKALHKSCWQFD